MRIERRRAIQGVLGVGVGLLLPRTTFAESQPSTEPAKSPTELMESYMKTVLPDPLLPGDGTPFEPTSGPIGRNGLLHHAYPYRSINGESVVITLTATSSNEPRLLTARLYEEGVTGNVRTKFEEEALNAVVSKYKYSPPLDQEPWNRADNEHIEGHPPTAEKTIITPEGHLESLSAQLNGVGPSYQIIYRLARAYPGSIQFDRRTVFVPSQ